MEREKYEERMGMKKLPPSKDRIAELEEKTQRMLDRLGPDQVSSLFWYDSYRMKKCNKMISG